MIDIIQEPAGKSVSPTEAYENLANAIVEKAAADYKAALHTLDKNPHSGAAMRMIREVEKFFHSGWYTMLTSLDPDALLLAIKKLVREEIAEKFERDKNRLVRVIGEAGCTIDAATVYYLTTVDFAEARLCEDQARKQQAGTVPSRWLLRNDRFSTDVWWRDPFGMLMFIESSMVKGVLWNPWQAEEAETKQMAQIQTIPYEMLPWKSLAKAAGKIEKTKTGKKKRSSRAKASAENQESGEDEMSGKAEDPVSVEESASAEEPASAEGSVNTTMPN